MNLYIHTRLLEKWFLKVNAWEESDFTDETLQWVCLKGVPIRLWHKQFFKFALVDFGQFLEALLTMVEKLNLKEMLIKIRCIVGHMILSKMEVQLPRCSHTISLEVFTPEKVPFYSVSGQLIGSDLSSIGSCYSLSPESMPMSPENFNKEKVGIQTYLYLLSCIGQLWAKFCAWPGRHRQGRR